MPITFDPEDLLRPAYENGERIEHLARETLAPLKVLMDALEDELAAAVSQEDLARVAMVAWLYGPTTALVTDIEIGFP